MSEDVDPLLAGRGDLDYAALDAVAHRVHDLLHRTAERQIDRPLLHAFDITVEADHSQTVSPPDGYRRPAAGAITTHVVVRSKDVPSAIVDVRVTVWPALGGADVADLAVARENAAPSPMHWLDIDLAEAEPEISDALAGRINAFVARQVALVVSELNVAMQRSIADWDGGEA